MQNFWQTFLETARTPLRFWEVMAFGAYALGTVGIVFYASDYREFGILWLVGTAAWVAGTSIGFLFGVPRVRAGESAAGVDSRTQIVPNTNLEQISDWLTKIIVGATLVQLGPIATSIATMSEAIGESLNLARAAQGAAVSGAVLVLFFAAGFIWGYLWCSLRIFHEMQALVERNRDQRSVESSIGQAIHQ